MRSDIEIFAGDSYTLRVNIYDQNTDRVDITGASVAWQMSEDVTSNSSLISKSTSSGITIIDPLTGVFEVYVAPADTTNLSGLYYHECQLTEAGGRVSTVVHGSVLIRPSLI